MIPHMGRVSFLFSIVFARTLAPARGATTLYIPHCGSIERSGRACPCQVIYITGGVLYQALPSGFARHLLRVVMYPGGSPLIVRTAPTSSTVAPPDSPAHALLKRDSIPKVSIPLPRFHKN